MADPAKKQIVQQQKAPVFGMPIGDSNAGVQHGLPFAVTTVSHQVSHQSGPLPPAEELIKYNNVVPGAAERIIQMTEKQSAHRIALESMVVKGQLDQSNRGQVLGFSIAVAFLIGAVVVTLYGYPWVGGILGGSTITVLGVAFITGKVYQGENLKAKKPPEGPKSPTQPKPSEAL